MKPRRPALRYYGGKWRIAPWIIGHFPPHDCYVEPFAGAASVLLRKPRSCLEYYNDSDGEVVNFFRTLRTRPEELLRTLRLTPFSREELILALTPADDDLERARRFYVRMWQGRGAHESSTGWRYQRQGRGARRKSAIGDWTDHSHLEPVVKRLREVAIEHDDALAVLRRYDRRGTLFYVDPPYLADLRSKRSPRYASEFHTEKEHRILAAVLAELDGMVVLSGKASPLYAELFEAEGWLRYDRETIDSSSAKSTESLWLNTACQNAQRQASLFVAEGSRQ